MFSGIGTRASGRMAKASDEGNGLGLHGGRWRRQLRVGASVTWHGAKTQAGSASGLNWLVGLDTLSPEGAEALVPSIPRSLPSPPERSGGHQED
jgi:hypothetical protein